MMLYREDEFAAAADAFRAANAHADGLMVESTFNLTLSLLRLERFREASEAIDPVVDTEALPEAWYLKGFAQRRLGQLKDAEAWLEMAEEAGYEKATVELEELRRLRDIELSEADGFADDPEKKLAYLQGLLARLDSLSPGQHAYTLRRAGRAATELGDLDGARNYFVQACRVNLTAEAATELAEFVLDYGSDAETPAAEAWLMQAISLQGRHGRAHFCLGRLQRNRGRLAQAFHCMQTALRSSSDDEYFIFETAELAAELGNLSYCLALLTRLEALANAQQDHYWIDRARTLRRSIGAY
jgi:tetratricopeptide (TPR) repeat protein